MGLGTVVKTTYKSKKTGPVIAYLAEYDTLALHTPKFRSEIIKDYAYDAMGKNVYSLAKTGYDICLDDKSLQEIKKEKLFIGSMLLKLKNRNFIK